MGKRELVALLGLASWCLLMIVWLFLAAPWVCLRFVIVVFPDHTRLYTEDGYSNGESVRDNFNQNPNYFVHYAKLRPTLSYIGIRDIL